MKTDLKNLDKSIATANRIVIFAMFITFVAYPVWFWGFHSQPLSNQNDSWGQFGDFIGGVLNPLVAYSAFYWLTRSVRLQKEELSETRQALKDSSDAQSKQATYAQVSVRIAAITALINSINIEVQMQRAQLQFIIERNDVSNTIRLLDGTQLSGSEIQAYITEINNKISGRMTERYEYETELKSLLKEHV